ncbi:MAG: restriction endonuclease subunit S [Prevotella sp.]|jgi:Restriction endonuclease S subunits|nr:restriction endonuclease subunit S [Prevotella sp.]
MSANKTKWVRLGDYIELCEERNSEEGNYPFCGINKDKVFMPTVADTNNLDSTKYKLVRKGTFVFSGMQTGRDVCIRIAMQDKDETLLVSPAYTTFTIKDTSKLNPQYLYMQFIRFEMDRYGWFLSDGSIRSNLDWERFCDIQIPLPSISIQRELVNTYNGLKSLAEDNEALIAPLTQACEALVVDCKRKYDEVELGEYIVSCDERNSEGKYTVDDVRGISTDKKFIPTKANMDGVSVSSYKVVAPFMFAYVADTSRRGDKIALALNSSEESYLVSSIYTVFKTCEHLLPQYLYMHLGRTEFDRYSRFNSWGSARETFDWSELCRVKIPLPPPDVQQSIVNLYHCIEEAKQIAAEAREQMRTLCPALIQKAIHS